MRITQFEIEDLNPTILINVNPHTELTNQQRIPTYDLKFEINAPNNILSLFNPHLHNNLYWSNNKPPEQSELNNIEPINNKPNLHNPILGTLSLSNKYTNYELTINLNLNKKHSNVELTKYNLGQFKIEPKKKQNHHNHLPHTIPSKQKKHRQTIQKNSTKNVDQTNHT